MNSTYTKKINVTSFLNSFINIYNGNVEAGLNCAMLVSVIFMVELKEENKHFFIDLLEFIYKDLKDRRFEGTEDLLQWASGKTKDFLALIK